MSLIRYQTVPVGRGWRMVLGMALAIGCLTAGCSALNPEAVSVLLPAHLADDVTSGTTENAPGHVVIFFINNTRFDGNVLNYLRDQGVDVDSDADLRPRVRFRVQVDFDANTSNIFEFVDGSDLFDGVVTSVDEQGNPITQSATPPPELTEDTLTNCVMVCDVGRVQPAYEFTDSSSSIEMFIPTFLKEITLAATELGLVRRELKTIAQPAFRALLVDSVGETGSVEVTRNFGTRDIPGFPTNLICGSVVTFVLSGDLTLPFVVDETNNNVPGYLDTDTPSQDAVPGRFELKISVR